MSGLGATFVRLWQQPLKMSVHIPAALCLQPDSGHLEAESLHCCHWKLIWQVRRPIWLLCWNLT